MGLHRSNENLEVAKRENSVIELEDDYSAKYQGFDPNSAESYIIFELNQSKHMEQSINFASYVQGSSKVRTSGQGRASGGLLGACQDGNAGSACRT